MRSARTLLIIGVHTCTNALLAQTPDATFGNSGYAIVDVNGWDEQFFDMVVQPDGRVLAAGTAWGSSSSLGLVCRFTASGDPDPTFSGDGAFFDGFGGADAQIRGIALQSDGKVVLAGSVAAWDFSYTRAFVLRLQANGSMDGTFGVGGYALLDDAAFTQFNELAVDAQGRIVAVGMHLDADGDLLVARFDANGNLDTGFDDAGLHIADIGAYWDELYDVRILDDGSIVAAGGTNDNGQLTTPVLLKLDDQGLPHPGFAGGAGFVEPVGLGAATNLHALPDGRLVTTVAHQPSMQAAVVRVVRTLPDGTPDATFGVGGSTDLGIVPGDCMWAGGVHADANGNVLVGGEVRSGCSGAGNFFLAALRPDGSPNGFFGNDGYFLTANAALLVGGAVDASGMAMADGKMLLSGSTNDGAIDGVLLSVTGAVLSVQTATASEHVQVHPQPAAEEVWLPTILGSVVDELLVVDATGRTVLHERRHPVAAPLATHALPNGLYTLRMTVGGQAHNAELMVQR